MEFKSSFCITGPLLFSMKRRVAVFYGAIGNRIVVITIKSFTCAIPQSIFSPASTLAAYSRRDAYLTVLKSVFAGALVLHQGFFRK